MTAHLAWFCLPPYVSLVLQIYHELCDNGNNAHIDMQYAYEVRYAFRCDVFWGVTFLLG